MGILDYDIKIAELSAKIALLTNALGWYKSEKDLTYIKNLLKATEKERTELFNKNLPF